MVFLHVNKTFVQQNEGKTEVFNNATYIFSPVLLPDGRYICSLSTLENMPLLFAEYTPRTISLQPNELPIYEQ